MTLRKKKLVFSSQNWKAFYNYETDTKGSWCFQILFWWCNLNLIGSLRNSKLYNLHAITNEYIAIRERYAVQFFCQVIFSYELFLSSKW